jgi:ribonuclease HI
LKEVVDKLAKGGSNASGSLAALGEGAWWTQHRMYQENFSGVTDPFCRACGPKSRFPSAARSIGTLYHRVVECEAYRHLRAAYEHPEVVERAATLSHSHEALYQHGVPIQTANLAFTPTFVARWAGGTAPDGDFTFSGNCFTDGSMVGNFPKAARRAGWAAIQVDSEGNVIAGIYGTCPDPFPTAMRAELWAIIQLLRQALPPVTVYTDCLGVIQGWRRGQAWCCSAARPMSDLWRVFWHQLSDVGQ